MATPSSRSELADYCKRQLGAPVLEINIADEQVEDILDDAIQFFQERHFDGVSQTFLKYKITQEDIDRGRATMRGGTGDKTTGITTETVSTTIAGISTTFEFYEKFGFSVTKITEDGYYPGLDKYDMIKIKNLKRN